MNFDFLDGIELTDLFTAAVRWVFVLLGIYILVQIHKVPAQDQEPGGSLGIHEPEDHKDR